MCICSVAIPGGDGQLWRCPGGRQRPLLDSSHAPQIKQMVQAIERYVLVVAGLPSVLAQKKMYPHHTRGLGLRYLAVLQPTRVLDSLHTNPRLFKFSTRTSFPLSPWRLFTAATALPGPPRSHPMIPLPVL